MNRAYLTGIRAVTAVAILSTAGTASVAAQDAKAQGAKVFVDQKCALCHSIDGKGNPKGPMEEALSKLSDDEIRAWITDAKGMTEKTKADPQAPDERVQAAQERRGRACRVSLGDEEEVAPGPETSSRSASRPGH